MENNKVNLSIIFLLVIVCCFIVIVINVVPHHGYAAAAVSGQTKVAEKSAPQWSLQAKWQGGKSWSIEIPYKSGPVKNLVDGAVRRFVAIYPYNVIKSIDTLMGKKVVSVPQSHQILPNIESEVPSTIMITIVVEGAK